jgi:hypothetical protein
VEQGQECFVMPRTTTRFVKEVTKDKCYTIAESYHFIYSVKSYILEKFYLQVSTSLTLMRSLQDISHGIIPVRKKGFKIFRVLVLLTWRCIYSLSRDSTKRFDDIAFCPTTGE